MNQQHADKELSVEERVLRLEREFNPSPPADEKEMQRHAQQDVEEITQIGLAERAWRELTTRIPGATVSQWTIGYFGTKDVVWCDFRYTTAPDTEVHQKEFGFRKTSENAWEIMWNEPVIEDSNEEQ